MRERIGPYRIESVIAEGGMGLVYKGRHETLGRCAAIKTLLPKNALDARSRERLVREARAQALLAHEYVVAVYDCIPEDGELFIAMEYVDGETVAGLMRRSANGRLTPREALPLMVQVLTALEHVHGQKIIHRDVKPSNVLVCHGLVKLTDFGIALMLDAPRLTAHEQRVGTREFMSPEQLDGGEIDHRTDIYSAGVLLYAMLAGRSPFPSRDLLQAIRERMAGPPDLRAVVSDLPPGLWEVLCIAMQMEPERRYRSAAAFASALKDLAAGFVQPARDPADDAPTEVLPEAESVPPVEVAPEPAKRSALAWIVIVCSVGVASYVLVEQTARFPAAAPEVIRARVVPILPAVELTTTTTTILAPPPHSTYGESVAPITPVPPNDPGRSEREAEYRRRSEIATLRVEIQAAIDRTEAALRDEQLTQATEALEPAAQKAERYPDDLWQERAAITQLRIAISDAHVALETRRQWEKRIADIEEDLQRARWPEAERFAQQIAEDAHAPPAIAERARVLLQQAKEGRIAAFRTMQLGPTTNAIRKPSTPPRKND